MDTESKIYKKLFDIKYNNKKFTIFLGEDGKKAFLEIDKDGKYQYPHIDDYISLYKIFNMRNPFILYNNDLQKYSIGEILPIHKPEHVKFKEKIKSGISFVAASLIIGNLWTSEIKNIYEIEKEYLKQKSITVEETIDNYLGTQSVSEEELINAINSNPNLNDLFKECAIELAKTIKANYPNTDNRIFYKNIKTLKVNELEDTPEKKYIEGLYRISKNEISIKSYCKDDKRVIIHELAHAYHNIINYDKGIYKCTIKGHSLDEAMNTKITSLVINDSTYTKKRKILDYLLNFTDYSYYDYEKYGIEKLYSMLVEKYPEIDIDYIFEYSDTIADAIDHQVIIQENQQILDILFDLATHSIDINNDPYKPLVNYLILTDNYNIDEVTKNYNDILNKLGYNKKLLSSNDVYEKEYNYNIENIFGVYLNNIDLKEISSDNVYKQFKDFTNTIKYDPNIKYYDIYINLLRIYNNFLSTNNIPSDKIININTFDSNYKKYRNINPNKYLITQDEKIYLIMDLPEEAKMFNQETRIPVLDKDGRITLIDINSVKKVIDNYNNLNIILNGFLDNPISNNYDWYDEKNIAPKLGISTFAYKKINIKMNNIDLAYGFADNYKVKIGVDENQKITFKLTDTNGNVLYQEGNQVYNVPINLKEYLQNTVNNDTIDLNNIFNEDYLKSFIQSEETLEDWRYLKYSDHCNKEYLQYNEEEGKINIVQRTVVILDGDAENDINLSDIQACYQYQKETKQYKNAIYLNNKWVFDVLDFNKDIKGPISLVEVLESNNMFDVNEHTYYLSTDEIINLYNNFLKNDLKCNNSHGHY